MGLRAVLQPQRRIPALSTRLTMAQKKEGDVVYLSMGKPGGREVFVHPHLAMPTLSKRKGGTAPAQKPGEDMFVSYFWAVPISQAKQKDACNMRVVFDNVKITSMEVKVPIMTNTAPLDVGDRLVVEPYNKRPKLG